MTSEWMLRTCLDAEMRETELLPRHTSLERLRAMADLDNLIRAGALSIVRQELDDVGDLVRVLSTSDYGRQMLAVR